MRNKLKKRKTEDDEKGDLDEKSTKDGSGKRLVKQPEIVLQDILLSLNFSNSLSCSCSFVNQSVNLFPSVSLLLAPGDEILRQ